MKATFWLLIFGLFVSCSVHAQTLTEPRLQTCPDAADGQSTVDPKWPGCSVGIKFVPVSSGGMVATGAFGAGTYRNFSAVSGETMVAVCPVGAILETESRCRTPDKLNWATTFVRKDSLAPQRAYTVTWLPVTKDVDGNDVAVTGYRVETSPTVDGPWTESARVAAPPAVVSLPSDVMQCFRVFALATQESDASNVRCHPGVTEPLSKPAAPIIIKLESAPAP